MGKTHHKHDNNPHQKFHKLTQATECCNIQNRGTGSAFDKEHWKHCRFSTNFKYNQVQSQGDLPKGDLSNNFKKLE